MPSLHERPLQLSIFLISDAHTGRLETLTSRAGMGKLTSISQHQQQHFKVISKGNT
jgi:hypothetical protein